MTDADARSGSPGWPRVALLSLSDKSGAAEFAQELAAHGTRILASGGTAAHLSAAGLEVMTVESWTGFAELLGGRVKTLHPHVHAPILARRDSPADLAELARHGLEPVDLVCVSLYPFESRAAALDDAGAIEEIDIGGVALLRAAAKNHASVVVLHDGSQFAGALAAYRSGGASARQRRAWAVGAFVRTARYDAAIASELARRTGAEEGVGAAGGTDPRDVDGASVLAVPPALHVVALERVRTLRYGENPHQIAALYSRLGEGAKLEAWKEGKELSFNNLLDLEAAVTLAGRFDRPSCVIVKHNQPCGAACADTLLAAWGAALRSDELSAFGGIVAFNRPLDRATAAAMAPIFLECVAAPSFEPEAVEALKAKKNLRLVRLTSSDLAGGDGWGLRLIGPWALLQMDRPDTPMGWRVASRRAPAESEWAGLRFAWPVCASARSNAIALARGDALIGLGSGQTSRVDAVEVALMKAKRAGHDVRGAVLASDGFFPFPDSVTRAAEAGIAAIIQPGGSVKDAEVIAEADARGIAMVMTGLRTFRH
ncbi:MAG: bifunctional phosphoribosylaminoimidazolecarboxamide formyltransferase/IMP cyclohydrolase [Candidatus Eisenbacteria bacterium]